MAEHDVAGEKWRELIRRWRNRLGVTQVALGKRMGINPRTGKSYAGSTIGGFESGKGKRATRPMIGLLAKVLCETSEEKEELVEAWEAVALPAELAKYMGEKRATLVSSGPEGVREVEVVEIPADFKGDIDMAVQRGSESGLGTARISESKVRKHSFAYRVDDRDMEPTLPRGAHVFATKGMPAGGQLCVAQVHGGVIVRRFSRQGDTVVLSADRPGAMPIVVKLKDVKVWPVHYVGYEPAGG